MIVLDARPPRCDRVGDRFHSPERLHVTDRLPARLRPAPLVHLAAAVASALVLGGVAAHAQQAAATPAAEATGPAVSRDTARIRKATARFRLRRPGPAYASFAAI